MDLEAIERDICAEDVSDDVLNRVLALAAELREARATLQPFAVLARTFDHWNDYMAEHGGTVCKCDSCGEPVEDGYFTMCHEDGRTFNYCDGCYAP